MTGTLDISIPTPAIIISVGGFAEATAIQVLNIYLRGDQRRNGVTVFLRTLFDETGGLKLVPLDESDPTAEQAAAPSALKKRQTAFIDTVKHAETIRSQINQHLHNIRTHDLLIHAGWGDEYEVPVNVYILADSKEPTAAGTLLPLACLMSDVTRNTNLSKVFALLNTAVFPPDAEDSKKGSDVEVYSFLLELDDLLREESRNRHELCKALYCDSTDPLQIEVYLFDSNKEGSVRVKDNDQMQVMVGNALLALMEDKMARKLYERHDHYEIAEQHSYYHSIGATAILYDPDSLQKACAARLSREFLESVVLYGATDVQVAVGQAEAIQTRLGDLRSWLERCIIEMPPVIGQVHFQPDTDVMILLLNDLKLAEMNYEHFHSLIWVQQVRDYLATFNQEVKPKSLACVNKNAQTLETDLTKILIETITALPVRPDLYPGGIQNASRTIKFLAANFDGTAENIKRLQQRLQQNQSKATKRLNEVLDNIQDIVGRAPNLPWIIRILPIFARIWAAPIFYARRYGKRILRLHDLNKEAVQLVQILCSIDVQNEALSLYAAFIPRLQEQINVGLAEYHDLEDRLDAVRQKLPADWPTFPLGQGKNGWDSAFRLPLVEFHLAEWALTKYHPSFNKWIYEFLAENSPMSNWRNNTSKAINDWIIQLAEETYAPLLEVTSEDIFATWANAGPGFMSSKPAVTPEMMVTAMRSSLPLLKPDFDAAGGSKSSTISSHALLGRPEWKAFRLPASLAKDEHLELIYTGNPYTAFFLQARHNVPMAALVEMTRSGKYKYLAMPPSTKQDYLIIQSQEGAARQSPEVVDPNNPDTVRK